MFVLMYREIEESLDIDGKDSYGNYCLGDVVFENIDEIDNYLTSKNFKKYNNFLYIKHEKYNRTECVVEEVELYTKKENIEKKLKILCNLYRIQVICNRGYINMMKADTVGAKNSIKSVCDITQNVLTDKEIANNITIDTINMINRTFNIIQKNYDKDDMLIETTKKLGELSYDIEIAINDIEKNQIKINLEKKEKEEKIKTLEKELEKLKNN